ncbi:MAG: 50S ribosomal protein L4 [Gemmatimonadota bacterium]
MKTRAYTTEGVRRKGKVELPASVFDGTVNEAALHQVVTAIRANRRQGTASTKTRRTITGGKRKPWRQKGTGRARAGSARSPLWRGGAVVFGPHPRSYAQRVPKKLRSVAIRSALNARALEGDLVIVEPFSLERPHTKAIVKLLEGLEAGSRKVLLLTDGAKYEVYLSARNLSTVLVKPWGEASAYDVLWSDIVVVEESALGGAAKADDRTEGESEQ